jgi:hypothetical protein
MGLLEVARPRFLLELPFPGPLGEKRVEKSRFETDGWIIACMAGVNEMVQSVLFFGSWIAFYITCSCNSFKLEKQRKVYQCMMGWLQKTTARSDLEWWIYMLLELVLRR